MNVQIMLSLVASISFISFYLWKLDTGLLRFVQIKSNLLAMVLMVGVKVDAMLQLIKVLVAQRLLAYAFHPLLFSNYHSLRGNATSNET